MVKSEMQFKIGDSLVTSNEGKCVIINIHDTSSGEFIEFEELDNKRKSIRTASLLSNEITEKNYKRFHHPIIFNVPREAYWFSVGFIAKHGIIELRTTPSTKELIPDEYSGITGCKINNKYVIYNPNKATYTDNARVIFEKPHDEIYDLLYFPKNTKGKTTIDISGNKCELYNKSFIWTLFSFGFRTGIDHDIDEIKEYLDFQPEKYKTAFNRGYKI